VDIKGDVALITGAAKRIGRAIALDLAKGGCDIAIHYNTSAAEAEETAEAVRQLGRRAVLLRASLTDPEATAALPDQAAKALGRLDILVNNASTFTPMDVARFSLAEWNRTLTVNLTAPMVLAHAAYPHLKAHGQGRIINLLDICAARSWPEYLAYSASKGGLTTLTQALAKSMAPDVRVNGVAPGAALFPEDYDQEQIKAITRHIPGLRGGTAEDVAAAVRFLIAGCDYMTGVILAVDGGRNIAW
jgi:NAD(P)-dependent dehydrogenase (short-subunit alcohol dehydrogenase family)